MSNVATFTCDICKYTTSVDPAKDKWYRVMQTSTLFAPFGWKPSFTVVEQQCISGLAGPNTIIMDICSAACLLAALNNFTVTLYATALPITLPPLPAKPV